MSADVYPLFSTPLYKTNLDRDDTDILSFTKNEKFIFLREEKNGHKSSSRYVLREPSLNQLEKDIKHNVDFFVYDVLQVCRSIEFHIQNSWIMKHETGHWSQDHYHEHCLVSGIYYFDVKENSGNITFVQNHMNLSIFPSFFGIPYTNKNIFNLKRFTITPKNGDLILFPSHLIHSVDVNLNESDRHCLAFNVFIKGTLGNDDSFNRLEFK